jgi:cation diffusion facilitator family transporter
MDLEVERRRTRRLTAVLVTIAAFFVVELIGARAAESDVLAADAFHLLMDVFALAISLGAVRLARAKAGARYSFGLRRVEPLAALVNGLLVLGVAAEIAHESLEHIKNPGHPKTGLMLVVALAALVVNGFSAWLLHGAGHHGHDHGHEGHDHDHAHGHDHAHARAEGHDHHDDDDEEEVDGVAVHVHHDLSIRGAWLHLLGDALGSVAALTTALAIRFGAPATFDPLASLIVVAILVIGAIRLLRDAVYVLLEAAPARLPIETVRAYLAKAPGVADVRDLRVWSLGTSHDAITAHVVSAAADPALAKRLEARLTKRFRAVYVAVQVEPASP